MIKYDVIHVGTHSGEKIKTFTYFSISKVYNKENHHIYRIESNTPFGESVFIKTEKEVTFLEKEAFAILAANCNFNKMINSFRKNAFQDGYRKCQDDIKAALGVSD